VRIVDPGGRRDYYDALQRTDEDRKTLWIRQVNPIDITGKWPFPKLGDGIDMWQSFRTTIQFDDHIIGFCGKIYPVLSLHRGVYQGGCYQYDTPIVFCRNILDVEAWAQHWLSEAELEQFYMKKWKYKKSGANLYLAERHSAFERYFVDCAQQRDKHMALFEKERSPLFVAQSERGRDDTMPHKSRRVLTYNAMLKPFEFFKVFDPAHAYQEILMFMNNLAVPMKPIPEMDDVTKAESKGFDKYSFRKDPIRKRKK
jgi:hypothetical protein